MCNTFLFVHNTAQWWLNVSSLGRAAAAMVEDGRLPITVCTTSALSVRTRARHILRKRPRRSPHVLM